MLYYLTVLGAVFTLSGEVISLNSTSPILQSETICEAAKETALAEIAEIEGAKAIAFCTEAGQRPQGSPARVNVTENNGPGRTP